MYRCAHPAERWKSWVWKAPLGTIIWSSPCSKQGQLRTACSGLHPVMCWISARMETLQPLWATYSSVWPLNSKQVISYVHIEFPIFLSMPIASLVVSLGTTTQKHLARLPYSSSPVRCLYRLIRSPAAFSSSGWLIPASASVTLNHLCGLLLDSFQYVHVSLVLGSPAMDTALQFCLSRAEQRLRITSLDLLAMLCLLHPGRLAATLSQGHIAGSCQSSQLFIICKHAEAAFGLIVQVTTEEIKQYWP